MNKLRKNKDTKKSSLTLTFDTHVPPYGYGKNHGWSRIIRISRKILPHALSLISDINLGSNSDSNIESNNGNSKINLDNSTDSNIFSSKTTTNNSSSGSSRIRSNSRASISSFFNAEYEQSLSEVYDIQVK